MSKRLLSLLGVLLLAGLVLTPLAGADGTVMVYGYVTDSTTSSPLDGVRINIKENGDTGSGLTLATSGGGYYQVAHLTANWGYDFIFRKAQYRAVPAGIVTPPYDGITKPLPQKFDQRMVKLPI